MQTDIAAIDVEQLLTRMQADLARFLSERGRSQPCLVGIHTGGVWIAERLAPALGVSEPVGAIDIAHYRDDYNERGLPSAIRPSSLPVAIDGRHVVLCDDVLMTGRTIRAALNILFDYGRPASVSLVELLEIPAREVPLQADICGQTLQLPAGCRVKLSGPQPMVLELVDGDGP